MMDMPAARRVVVTGIGLVTPLGIGLEKTWKALCAGQSGIARITRFDPTDYSTQIAGEVKDFDPAAFIERKEIKKMDLFIHFAVGAAQLATDDAGLKVTPDNAERVGVYIGSGIGGLTIIDDDAVELANLHRQPLFSEGDAGQPKAELAAKFARGLNSHVAVRPIQERIGAETARQLLPGHDLVIDGSDNFATRLAVSDACVALVIPLLSAAAVQFQGQVGLFRSKPCYRCFVGDAFDADDCDNCAELGVLGALAATVGSFAALLAIDSIVGIGPDQAAKIHLFDGEKLNWRVINIPADPACRACGSA